MTQQYNAPTEGISPEQLSAWQRQLDGATAKNSPTSGIRPTASIAKVDQVTIQNGVVTSATSNAKTSSGTKTVYATPTEPGFIPLPGGGKTTVEAAKAGGLIPHTWKEGDSLPFDQAPAKGAPASNSDAPKDTPEATPDTTHAAHLAKLAGDVLRGVDQTHGPQVTDALVDQVADSGDPDSILDQLPAGVSPTHVKQVMAGYIAQANDMLSTVGASVPLLEQMLDADELRQARRATLSNAPEEMARLGQVAVDRLAQMPTTDPETFREMVEGMDPKARKMIRHDRNSGQWIVSLPGHPDMAYGAAVRLGLVKV
jgi:hypothetical protein